MKTKRNRWTEKEVQFIKEAIVRGKNRAQIASELKYRTFGAVSHKIDIIKTQLKKDKPKQLDLLDEAKIKKCPECSISFQPYSRGTEKVYCSSSCRSTAAQKRYKERMINLLKDEVKESLQKKDVIVQKLNQQDFIYELNKITELADIAGLELTITITKKTF
jgi:hypothetical protein